VDVLVESRAVMVNSVANNRIEIIDCRLIGGRTDIDYFGLLRTTLGMDELIIRNFYIESLVSHTKTGKLVLINLANDDVFKYVLLENIEIHGFDWRNKGGVFLSIGPNTPLPHLVIDGFIFFGGTWNDTDIYLVPISGHVDYLQVDDMTLMERFHPVIIARILEVNNFIGIGDGDTASFDCGSAGKKNKTAVFTNSHFVNASLDMNTGWSNLEITNCYFNNSRVWIGDEGSPTGQEKNVQISNCRWKRIRPGKYTQCIVIGYAQGVNLAKLQITNVLFYVEPPAFMYPLSPSGASSYPTHIILENVVVRTVSNPTRPTLFGDTARDSDDHIVWIFDSEITTNNPPLGNWNPIRPNDRFENVKWINTSDSGVSWSESRGNATISSGTSSVTVNHILVKRTPWTTIQVTPTSDWANCTQFWWDWASFTNTQFVIRMEGNTDDDVTFNWYADVN